MHLRTTALLIVAACGSSTTSGPDGAVPHPDAGPGAADAMPGTPDAVPGTPDAMPGRPDATPATADAGPLADILERLQGIPGMTVEEVGTTTSGYRAFAMTYDQPEDHDHPEGARFQQRLTLLHRDETAPTVLFTTGYHLSTGGRAEVTRMVSGNQVAVEHRFFGPSRADPADWTKLNVAQAAADFHSIVEALKPIYSGRWLSTGASKGGDTMVFHRRFYPDDVDGTIAYVAPIDYQRDMDPTPDNRTIVFLQNVGTDANCRQHLHDFQRLVLVHRSEMLPFMDQIASSQSSSWDQLLGEERALEFGVVELPFIFWQYGGQNDCSQIPSDGATAAVLFNFLDGVVDMYSYSDRDLTAFLPYYHQTATELATVVDDESYLLDLEMYPFQDRPRAYVPADIATPDYNPQAMVDIQDWVAREGQRILLVYGGRDPWSATAFDLGAAQDSFRFYVATGNHGSNISALSSADKAVAVDAVSRWAGLSAKLAPGDARAGGEPDPLLEGRHPRRRREAVWGGPVRALPDGGAARGFAPPSQ